MLTRHHDYKHCFVTLGPPHLGLGVLIPRSGVIPIKGLFQKNIPCSKSISNIRGGGEGKLEHIVGMSNVRRSGGRIGGDGQIYPPPLAGRTSPNGTVCA